MKEIRTLSKKTENKIEDTIPVDKIDIMEESDEKNVGDTSNIICRNVTDEMRQVADTVNEIKSQNVFKAMFLGSKNEKALADNDIRISNAIKNMMNWMLVVTSSEIARKEEYDDLVEQMIKFDDDINTQLQMQVKFKRAYEIMQKREKQLLFYKILSTVSAIFSIISMVLLVTI